MLLKRIMTGFVLAAGSFLIICWGVIPLALEVLAISVLGLNEFYDLAVKKNIRPSKITGILCGIIIIAGSCFLDLRDQTYLFSLIILYTMVVFIFRKSYHVSSFLDAGMTILGYLYICWLFSFIIQLRKASGVVEVGHFHLARGAAATLVVVFSTCFTDIGSFFVGKVLGRTKLCPQISPGKTVEGSVGGLAFSVLVAYGLGVLFGLNIWHSITLGVLIGIVSQLGDLWESVLKRDVAVKDSGEIVAGHGGILDRFDSMFFTSPLGFIYFSLFLMG